MARGPARHQCYRQDCTEDAVYAFSWRIRGPKRGAVTKDRIEEGNTATTAHSCPAHLPGMRDVLRGLFRD